MFGLFKKNSSDIALVKYANNAGFLFKSLKDLDKLIFDEACNNVKCLTVYYIKEIVENPIMDNLDITFKCMIPEMYGLRWKTIAFSSAELMILLNQMVEKYNLTNEFNEILQKGNLFYEYENCYNK